MTGQSRVPLDQLAAHRHSPVRVNVVFTLTFVYEYEHEVALDVVGMTTADGVATIQAGRHMPIRADLTCMGQRMGGGTTDRRGPATGAGAAMGAESAV